MPEPIALLLPYLPGFVDAAIVVVELTAVSLLLSWVLGLALAIAVQQQNRLLRALASFYIWFIRGTPALVQVFIVYFATPQFGLRLSPFVAGIIALGCNSAAFVAEIFRGGFLAVPRTQHEAAAAIGLSRAIALYKVILPQVLRVTLPPMTNEAITLLKNTSLLSTITIMELTLFSQMAIARTFRPFEFYMAVALIYLALSASVAAAGAALERKLSIPR
jgi:polar amino acid transport system permease protein